MPYPIMVKLFLSKHTQNNRHKESNNQPYVTSYIYNKIKALKRK